MRRTASVSFHSYNSTFDLNTEPIGIDTCATASISGNRKDFVGKLDSVKDVRLRGVGGTIPIIGRGTMVLHITDDKGKEQTLKVHDAYYAPRLPMRLFCPQQWSRQGPICNDGSYERSETTTGWSTRLKFAGGRKTIPHDERTGLPIMYTQTDRSEFAHYIQTQQMSTYKA